MKRLIAVVAAFLLSTAGVVALETPANASWNDNSFRTHYIKVGEQISWDWNLCGEGAYNHWFTEGALPPGLTLNGDGTVTGAATATGSYYMGGWHCSVYFPGYGNLENAGSNSGGMTIDVTQDPSPVPNVQLTSLVNQMCEFEITGSVPETPNAGAVTLALSNGTSSGTYILTDLTAGTPFTVRSSLVNLSTMLDNSAVVSVDQAPSLACGDTITATLSYSTGFKGIANATSTALVDLPEPPTIVSVANLNDAMCNIRVVGTLPTAPDAGSVQLTFTDGTDVLVATLTSSTVGQLIDLTIPTKPFSVLELPVVASVSSTNDYQPTCGSPVSVTLSFQHLGAPPIVSKATAFVTPTKGIVGVPTVSLNVIGGPTCLVAVTAYIPMASQDTSLFVSNFDGEGTTALALANYPTDRPFTILVPLNAADTINSPYVTGDPTGMAGFTCGDAVTALVTLADFGTSMSNLNDTVHSEFTEPQATSFSCGLGTVKSIEGVCAPALRGFYVNALDALTATACPVGYTTAGIGTTSVNDCYKVLVQTVSKLKAPKALKFKAIIPLPVVTTAKVNAQVTASGPCTVTTVAAGGKVAGKKVKVATLAVTAGTAAGNCVLTYSSPEVQRYGTYSKTLTIKVNKTGK